VEQYGEQNGFPLIGCERLCRDVSITVYISTGMHGDEPAGPLALLKLLGQGLLPRTMNFVICPLLNPAGLSLGTRENPGGVDLNRDYLNPATEEVKAHIAWLKGRPKFDLVMLMHEDCDEAGFYLNDFAFPGEPSYITKGIMGAVSLVCPVDSASSIDGRSASDGVTRPLEDSRFEGHWPESYYLHQRGAPIGLNFESPSSLPLETRIAAHIAAVEAGLDVLPNPYL
jgi:hypothetical protein